MAFNKYESDDKQGHNVFMDGIPVKISEKYKPPKKITLPSGILNRLNTDTSSLDYDFKLERSMVDKMGQWRQLRKSHTESRRQRIKAEDSLRQATEAISKVNLGPPDPAVSPPTKSYPILTPVPIVAPQCYSDVSNSKGFNISEFEQDTSSPFDNMELKTINDLEELAHVLQPSLCSDRLEEKEPPPRINGLITQYSRPNLDSNDVWTMYNHNYNSGVCLTNQNWAQEPSLTFPYLPSRNPTIHSYVVQRLDYGKSGVTHESTSSKSVPDIVQELELELKDKRSAETQRKRLEQPQRPASIGATEVPQSAKSRVESTQRPPPKPVSMLPNPISQLGPACQRLCHRLAEMGFPLPRVARAAEMFGDDEGRIVEFLLQVQSLEESNYPPDRAEKALIVNNYKEAETVEYLQTMCQLLDLGFREEKVVQALAKFGNNRDKALDSLIS